MGQVRLLCGAGRSARAAHIDGLLRGRWGRALLVVPAHAQAGRRLRGLFQDAALPGGWGRPVRAFTDFAEALLAGEGRHPRRVNDAERRLLLEAALERIEQEGRIPGIPPVRETPGLVSHLLRLIGQLKQAAIEPEEFRARTGDSGGPFDSLAAEAYARYQDALVAADAYDVPGLYWQADLHCRERRPHIMDGIDTLLFDGFDDFTPSEFRLLEGLAAHTAELVIGLNYDDAPGRADLYALQAETAARIQERFNAVRVSFESASPDSYTSFVAQSLFWRDPPEFPAGLRADLRIAPCGDLRHETEWIGREIKRIVREEKVRPEDIAVVYRHIGEAAPLVRTVFAEFGIPVRIAHQPSLLESGIGQFVLLFLSATADWRRHEIVDLLASPWLRPDPPLPGTPEDAAQIARAAQIVRGPGEWEDRLAALEAGITAGTAECPGCGAEDVAALRARVRALIAWSERIPSEAPARTFAEILDELLGAFGLERAAAACDADRAAGELAALESLRGLLETVADASGGALLSRGQFGDRLERGLRDTGFTIRGTVGGVYCGDIASIRNLDFDYVFAGGLNEEALPLPPASNAVYPESAMRRLREAGIPLEGRREHAARERLLFHHLFGVARRGLTLCWRLLKAGNREASPSPFLAELREIFPDAAGIDLPLPRSDSFLPQPALAACTRDVRNFALGLRSAPPTPLRDRFPEAFRAAEIERQRHDESPFGPCDGMIGDSAARAVISARYGEEHSFSAAQLETYLQCPFHFFASRVLGLEETREPDEEFDDLVRGTILHEALQRFHAGFPGQPVCAIPLDDADAAMVRAVDEAFRRHAWKSLSAPDGVIGAERARMLAALRRYLIQERDVLDDPWRPSHFEVAFGGARGGAADPRSTPDALVLESPSGPIRLAGRIDRVDFHRDAGRARVIDYKTGTVPSASDVKRGAAMQLPLYAIAWERIVMPQIPCGAALYRAIYRRATRDALKDPEAARQTAIDAAGRAAAGIRDGQFPPKRIGAVCHGCGAAHACRYDKARIARKTGALDEEAPESGE